MVTLGMDIGGTNIRLGAVDRQGNMAAFQHVRKEAVFKEADCVEALNSFVQSFMAEKIPGKTVGGLCIGLPATLNRDKTTICNAPNVKGLDGVCLGWQMQAALKIPVWLLRDVEALFYFDRTRMPLEAFDVIAAVYVGTGIGNVIVIEGKVLQGAHGRAGELGHIPQWGSQETCGCGNTACVEPFCGGKYLARLQQESFPQTPIQDLFVHHAGHPLLQEYIQRLAIPFAAEVNILDPGALVLGGGVTAMAGFPMQAFEQEIRRHVRKPLPEQELQIFISCGGDENGVVGAGCYVWEQLEQHKTARKQPKRLLCPSMMCADVGHLDKEISALEEAGADIFHLDMMDGAFVPNFGMGLQDIRHILKNSRIACDVHLMIENPGVYVELFADMGANIIYVHPETDRHCLRTLERIRAAGVKPGIALNPGTAVETIYPLLQMAAYVLVMTVNPGFAGQAYLPFVDEKIDRLLQLRRQHNFQIVIDGACAPGVIQRLGAKGVDGFVLGTAALFGKERPYGEIMRELRAL